MIKERSEKAYRRARSNKKKLTWQNNINSIEANDALIENTKILREYSEKIKSILK